MTTRTTPMSKEWCMNMAKLEEGHEIGAGIAARDPVAEPDGLKNLIAIINDQPHLNSCLTVIQIRTILENKGGFMPDEAVVWFREWSET